VEHLELSIRYVYSKLDAKNTDIVVCCTVLYFPVRMGDSDVFLLYNNCHDHNYCPLTEKHCTHYELSIKWTNNKSIYLKCVSVIIM